MEPDLQVRRQVPSALLRSPLRSASVGHWLVPEAQEASRIINPGKPESSALIRRVKSRRPLSQMPPLGSVLVDKQALELLTSWVQSSQDLTRCADKRS